MTSPRRLLAVTTLVTVALALSGFPAGAAPGGDAMGDVTTEVPLRDFTLPLGGPAVGHDLPFLLSADEPGWANEVTLTVDASAASAVAEVNVTVGDDSVLNSIMPNDRVRCATTDAVTRCTAGGPHRVHKRSDSLGDTGTITVKARADNGPITTETSRVRIGQGVDLTAVDEGPRTVAPGASAVLRPQVRNTGPRDVKGLILRVYGDDSSLTDTNFGNCVYDYDYDITCTFDTTLESGSTYALSAPFTVKAPHDAVAGSRSRIYTQWDTLADRQDWRLMRWPGARQGTGAKLKLKELVSAATADVPQTDIDGYDNATQTTVTVTGGQPVDVAAVGATITGLPGETRTIEVGAVNHGPGTLHYPQFFNNRPWVTVRLPLGVAVVRADKRCQSWPSQDSAGPPPSSSPAATPADATPLKYTCWAESERLRPGQRLSFAFTVRVAGGARDGEGSAEVSMNDGEDSIDQDAGNNNAVINLSVDDGGLPSTGDPGRDLPATGDPDDDQPATGDTDGGLPVTGAATATVAGVGALLVLLGTALTVALRRRTRWKA